MQAQELLTSATEKTKALIEQHRRLVMQLDDLKKELIIAKDEIQQVAVDKEKLISENRELKEQIKTIKLAQSLASGQGDQNSRYVKTTINEYIREIDKCLSLLNRE